MKAPRIEADIQHVVKKEKRSSNTCVHIYMYIMCTSTHLLCIYAYIHVNVMYMYVNMYHVQYICGHMYIHII